MSEGTEAYKHILTRLIKKQIVLLGSELALAACRKNAGITVLNDGTVTDISADDPKKLMQTVLDAYIYLSGETAKVDGSRGL